MFLNSCNIVTDQRAQTGSIHLGHGSGPAMTYVSGSQISAEGQLVFFQHLEDLVIVEGNVVLVGCFWHHIVAHCRVEQDRSRHKLVEFEHHFIVLLRFGEVELKRDVHPVHVHGVVSDWLEHYFLGLQFADHLLDFSFPDIRESDGSGLGW